MPIEIRELIIRTTVTADEAKGAPPAGAAASRGAAAGKPSQADIVAECVEQVMEILREERER